MFGKSTSNLKVPFEIKKNYWHLLEEVTLRNSKKCGTKNLSIENSD